MDEQNNWTVEISTAKKVKNSHESEMVDLEVGSDNVGAHSVLEIEINSVNDSGEEEEDISNKYMNMELSEVDNSNSESTKNDEKDNTVFIHPELYSIFDNYTEFTSSSDSSELLALKNVTALEDEQNYVFFYPGPDDLNTDVDDYFKHCNVCLEYNSNIAYCGLCSTSTCFWCMTQYLETSIMDGVIKLYCPSEEGCSKLFSEKLISSFVKPETYAILTKIKVDSDNNPNVKTCPGCHKVTKRTEVKQSQKGEDISRVNCSCGMAWCFPCYSPWHTGLSCKSYQKDVVASGDKALRFWAKVGKKGRKNARKCPKCKVYIERTTGCDHMFCKRCKTNFCYRCGSKHYDLGMLGNHYSTYSFAGCKYNLHPNKPVLRVAKRGGIFLGTIVLSPIALSGFVVLATVWLPAILIYRRCCK